MSKVQSMEKKNVDREVWNRVQRIGGHRVLRKSQLSFFKKVLKKLLVNHKFSIQPQCGLLEKNCLFTS